MTNKNYKNIEDTLAVFIESFIATDSAHDIQVSQIKDFYNLLIRSTDYQSLLNSLFSSDLILDEVQAKIFKLLMEININLLGTELLEKILNEGSNELKYLSINIALANRVYLNQKKLKSFIDEEMNLIIKKELKTLLRGNYE